MNRMSVQTQIVAVLSIATLATTTLAQTRPEPTREGGQRLIGTVTQAFEADTNFGLTPGGEDVSYFSTTTLGLAYITETRSQRFALFSDVELRGISRDGDAVDFVATVPSLALEYSRNTASSRLETDVSFRETSLRARRGAEGAFGPGGGFTPPGDLTPEDGTGRRRDINGNFALNFGDNGPVQTRLSFGGRETTYTGAGTDLNDSREVSASAGVTFRINPVLTGDISANGALSEIDTTDEDSRQTADIRAGLEYSISELLLLSSGIGYRFDERETLITRERLEGPTIDGGFRLSLRRTSIGGGVTILFPDNRDPLFTGTLDISREWQRGDASAIFALETTEGGETITTITLEANREIGRGTLNFGASRNLQVSRTGDDLLVTAAGVAYSRDLTERLNFRMEAAAAQSENLDTNETDRSQLRLSVGTEYELSERATLSAQYSHRRQSIDDEANGHSLRVAVEIPFGR